MNRIPVRGLVMAACLFITLISVQTSPSGLIPSFSPATAQAASILPTDFIETELGTGYGTLTGFVMLPDGRTLFTEKGGRIRVRSVGGGLDTALVIGNVHTVGEAGLAGIAVDPDWPVKPFIYVHYTRNAPRNLIVARYRATGDLTDPNSVNLTLSDPYIILELDDSFSNHNGGALKFGPSGYFYVALGDDVQSCVAQDSTYLKGVIARLTLANLPETGGGPAPRALLTPPDNPFAPDTTGAELVWCLGLRNPFRFSIDPYTERLFIGDVGGNTWEEVDIAEGGENFGWPIYEAEILTGVDCFQPLPLFDSPSLTYWHDPSDPTGGVGFYAIVGGPIYRGGPIPNRFPLEYEGTYFYSDVQKGWIRCARDSAGTWVPKFAPGQADSVNWAKGLGFVTDLQQGQDGALYYTTYNGAFRRISYPLPVTGNPDVSPAAPIHPRAEARPNPFRAGTTTRFTGMTGRLSVFDTMGRLVRRLDQPAWDGLDDSGSRVAPGLYWVASASGERLKTLVVR